MSIVRRIHKSDIETEKRILTGLIVSDKVISVLYPYLDPNIFELDISKRVVQWAISYFDKYKSSTKKHIQDIFEAERQRIKQESVVEEIEQFLAKLSSDYLSEDDNGINDDFIIDQGKAYLKERNLKKIASDMISLIDIGKTDEAEKLYNSKKQFVQDLTYEWVAPFDDVKYINDVFEERETPLFRMRGNLGELFGDFYRGWFMAIMGPMKRGKTWNLQDVAFDALLSHLRVAVFSLEMKDKHLSPRLYKQLGVFGDEDRSYVYPCFDCCYNQDNSCNKSIRTNGEACPTVFEPEKKYSYTPCTACRNNPTEKKDFLPTVWYFTTERPALSRQKVRDKVMSFQKMFGKNKLRLRSFPAYSASILDIERELDILLEVEGFIPDVIITDYATIMAPTTRYNDPRHHINDVFMAHKRMAQERSAFVITGTQSLGMGRAALNKDMQDESDVMGDARILANVDIMATLDQTQEEKEKNIWRIGIVEHRWRMFNKRRQVMALQQLELGQPVLDSEIIYWSGKVKGEDNEKQN